MKRVKNSDSVDHVWLGQTVAAGEYFTIDPTRESVWANDPDLLVAITNSIAIINDGTNDIVNINDAINFIKGSLPTQVSATIITQPPFGNKNIVINGVTKKLFARYTGFQYTLVAGVNNITWTCPYAWAKMLGVETINCEALDTVDFKVFDNAQGSYSDIPNLLLNQFGFAVNLPKDYYLRMANFDADIYAGMMIGVTYTSVSAKTIGINLIVDEVK